jgi:uncharacterized protein with HEPN domain
MPRSAKAHLLELQKASQFLLRKSQRVDLDAYLRDEELRLMVERQFIHIGEVMSQLRREFPEVAIRFADAAKIVDFRNFIIHRYWDVDDEAVWLTLTTKVEPLLLEVEAILLRLS